MFVGGRRRRQHGGEERPRKWREIKSLLLAFAGEKRRERERVRVREKNVEGEDVFLFICIFFLFILIFFPSGLHGIAWKFRLKSFNLIWH